MKTSEVIELLRNKENYILEFSDYNNYKRELSLVLNDGDYHNLHWKVFDSLLWREQIYKAHNYSTMQPDTETNIYKLKEEQQ